MNYRMIFYTMGNILKVEAALLGLPLIVSLIYKEQTFLSFIIVILILFAIGLLLTLKKPKNQTFFAREGFIIVGLSWILISLFGCLPFVISGEIPSFVDAFFETVSGFTTTGASILNGEQIESLSKSLLMWRSFTHWIGGMGVLVFILAILPSSEGQNIYILRAESPGPQVGKMVSKLRFTARILYLIYLILTIVEIILLVCGKMPLFDAICNSFATAGTGGFAIRGDSIASYNNYAKIVIGIFMLLFGVNFNIYYLLLIKKFKQVLKSEEIYWYFGIVIFAVIAIWLNTGDLLNSFFQVSSIITTTGFSTVDFNQWAEFAKVILVLLMFIGACAGSTGGGLKVSRVVIIFKTIKREIQQLIHPHTISNVRFEDNIVEEKVIRGILVYLAIFVVIFTSALLVISFDGFDFTTNFTAVAACINNIGPGLNIVGPAGTFGVYSPISKLVLIFSMLVGRLEIFPILLIFSPKVWLNK